ncbi:hypothetical protein PL78_17030 [Yersinia entomophaga]|uniref:Bacteriocin n=1 Tax=Yersinia entomophaga TaxID=935293 RepID=A0ABM6BPV0_YERET|nr:MULTISPECIES: hypothetical protein [Yersinia]ANI31515.1 hypothetical protein PL78_17030 [Yersinia entomophaga]OWF87866.1 hypothetical protein B4914_09825 [Yersinia entomophaga]
MKTIEATELNLISGALAGDVPTPAMDMTIAITTATAAGATTGALFGPIGVAVGSAIGAATGAIASMGW